MLKNIQQLSEFKFCDETYIWKYKKQKNGSYHLGVWRKDKKPVLGWDILQEIKNYTFGGNKIAVEMYPSKDRVVNKQNMRHLFILTSVQLSGLGIKGV